MSVAEINPFRYRGYYYDYETGCHYLQFRYYNPELCRFINADDFNYINNSKPILNAYCSCANNPIMRSDYLYFKDVFQDSFMNAFKNWSVNEFIGQLFGEGVSSFLDLFDIFNSFNENFSDPHLFEYSIIASFVDMGSLMLAVIVLELAISTDMANDLIKQILSNIELGYIWEKYEIQI